MILYLDIETYNPVDSISAGLYRYAENAEIILFAYAIDDGPVRVLEGDDKWGIKELISTADLLIAHNSNFDRTVLENNGLVPPQDKRWRDTMVIALQHSLPAGLGVLSDLYKLPIDKAKDKEGRTLIQLFCKNRPDGSRPSPVLYNKEWQSFKEYCKLDVEACRALYNKLPKWNCNPAELDVWQLDQAVNARGFLVDKQLACAAIEAVEKEKTVKNNDMFEMTAGAVFSAGQGQALIQHIKDAFGVTLPDLQKSTVQRRLDDPELSEDVKEILRARLLGSGTAVAKYKSLLKSISSDDRLRGTLQYCGSSRAGRWSGRVFQPQNLPRPTWKNKEIDTAIDVFKSGCADIVYNDVSEAASNCIRGVIVAPEKHKLCVSDLSAIEGRVLAWLSGEKYKVEGYRAGIDMYVQTYAKTFSVKPATVTKAQRQLGKVLELALGYGGGVGAFVTFANAYRINLDEIDPSALNKVCREEAAAYYDGLKEAQRCGLSRGAFITCDAIKRMWRKANKNTVEFWNCCESGFRYAIDGEETQVNFIKFEKRDNWVLIRLPSGRFLSYAGAHTTSKGLAYRGVDQYTRKWGDLYTYSGKIVENITQAVARDVLADAMLAADSAGYRVVLSVHDELITEVSEDSGLTHEILSKIMSMPPTWAQGLPLSAAGFEAKRYRKD